MLATLIGQLLPPGSVANGLAILSLAVVLGLCLGAVRFRGFKLGISGVLFVGLVFGQIGLNVDGNVLEFLRDFSLITFVYAVGLQVGPSFVTSLRAEGLRLNLLSLAVVGLGTLVTMGVIHWGHLPRFAASGLYTGAFTTTPGLGAGQDALRQALSATPDRVAAALSLTGLAYAASYPIGLIGPILAITALRRIFRVDLKQEHAALALAEQGRREPLDLATFEVTVADQAGQLLKDHPLLLNRPIVFTRLLRKDAMTVPTGETRMELGDIYRATGPRHELARLVATVGRPRDENFYGMHGDVNRSEIVVTRTQVLRRPLRELDLIRRTGVTLARINRAGIDLPACATLKLHFGDHVTAVGPAQGLKQVETELGNSPEMLNRPQLIPIFLGIVLGVIVGSIPLTMPGLKTPMRIGLAGGPMLVAIALSQLGNIGAVVWYMPTAANQLFRDFGLAVFLACVGLQAGGHFIQRMIADGGFVFMGWGVVITLLPVLLVGCIARGVFKMNFLTLSGWIAGAMTSSTALLFADEMGGGSDAPAVAYAAVAPLAMLAPVICAQLLVAAFM